MIEQQPDTERRGKQTRKVPIHERSVRVGDIIVVNARRANREALKARLAEGGYRLHETSHFLVLAIWDIRSEKSETYANISRMGKPPQ